MPPQLMIRPLPNIDGPSLVAVFFGKFFNDFSRAHARARDGKFVAIRQQARKCHTPAREELCRMPQIGKYCRACGSIYLLPQLKLR
jgi:hypothetical protein